MTSLRAAHLALLSLFIVGPVHDAGGELLITYIANEGFIIESGGKKVLIDTPLDEGLRHYDRFPAELREKLEKAEAPFDGVDLILATHNHPDHFGPKAVATYLRANPETRFISTPQAIEMIKPFLDGRRDLLDRVEAVMPAEGEMRRIVRNGIEISVLRLHHGVGSTTENLGFLAELGGIRWIHVGDAEATTSDLEPLGLRDEEIDVALLPTWLLAEPRLAAAVRQEIAPRWIVAMHLAESSAPASYFGPAGSREAGVHLILDRFPNVTVFDRPGDRRVFPPDK